MASPIQTTLTFGRDDQSFNTFIRNPPYFIYNGTLTAAAEQTITVPATAGSSFPIIYAKYFVLFAPDPGTSLWVAINATAAVPTGAVAIGTSELNPVGYYLKQADVIHLITNDATLNFSAAFYGIQTGGQF